MRLLFTFLFYALINFSLSAQYIDFSNARSIAISGASDASGIDYSGKSNPAGLVSYANLQFGLDYYNRFMLSELGVQSVYTVVPALGGSFAGRIIYFGSKVFNESRFSVSYGHKISSWMTAGIDLNYHYFSIGVMNDNHSAVSGNFGIAFHPINDLTIGVLYQNPGNIHGSNDYRIKYPVCIAFGSTYNEAKKFLISCKLSWTDYQWIDIALGTEVFLTENLTVRAGIEIPSSMSYSFGAGFFLHNLNFDLGFEQHPVLGLSSAASITLQITPHETK